MECASNHGCGGKQRANRDALDAVVKFGSRGGEVDTGALGQGRDVAGLLAVDRVADGHCHDWAGSGDDLGTGENGSEEERNAEDLGEHDCGLVEWT